jgi:hypothetical protein
MDSSIQSKVTSHLTSLLKFLYVEHFVKTDGGVNEVTISLTQTVEIEGLDKAVQRVIDDELLAIVMNSVHRIYRHVHETSRKEVKNALPT